MLATTIDKYCYLNCRHYPPFFDHKFRTVYAKSENCRTIDEISHPVIREVLRYLKWENGVEIHHVADLPARAGIGSSSSFTVGLLHALYGLKGQMVSPEKLAAQSIHIEQELLREVVGSQDQVSTAYGGFNHIRFLEDGSFEVTPMILAHSRVVELQSHLMLFYTGIRRTASQVAGSYISDIDAKQQHMKRMADLLTEGIDLLQSGRDIGEFGRLLNEAWQIKRSLGPRISNSLVDDIYERARRAGALGGKIAGAGGGGFMMLFVPPDRQVHVREMLSAFIHVPFEFETSGSQVVYYDRQDDYSVVAEDLAGRDIDAFRELEDVETSDFTAFR